MHPFRLGAAGVLIAALAVTAPTAVAATPTAKKPAKTKILKSTAKAPKGYTCKRERRHGKVVKVCKKKAVKKTPTTSAPSTSPAPPVSSAPSTTPPPVAPPVTAPVTPPASGGGGSTPTPPAPVTSTVFSNYSFPGYFVSQPFQAQQVKEFGAAVTLSAGARSNAVVSTVIASYACGAGNYYDGTCLTTPGSTYNLPVILSVYNREADGSVGTLVTRVAKTQTINYRPSAAAAATGCSNTQYLAGDGVCRTNFPTQVSFDLGSAVLPTNAIVTVAINTSTTGWDPTGVPGPADSTNIAEVGPGAGDQDVYSAPQAGDLAPVASDGYQPTFAVVTTG